MHQSTSDVDDRTASPAKIVVKDPTAVVEREGIGTEPLDQTTCSSNSECHEPTSEVG